MSSFVTDGPAGPEGALPLTGERTIPGLAEENYWFRRHEVVYQRLADRCAGRDVLDAGCGEGYGADLIADVARHVIGLDYDEATVAHVRASYPRVDMRHGNLAELPLPDSAVDVVVNFQVIEHLWDQPQFVAECLRVLRPSGLLMMSTPNRITFSPGRDTPVNPFHTRELNAAELTELLLLNHADFHRFLHSNPPAAVHTPCLGPAPRRRGDGAVSRPRIGAIRRLWSGRTESGTATCGRRRVAALL
jgi:SAM-dependent methyltransferase